MDEPTIRFPVTCPQCGREELGNSRSRMWRMRFFSDATPCTFMRAVTITIGPRTNGNCSRSASTSARPGYTPIRLMFTTELFSGRVFHAASSKIRSHEIVRTSQPVLPADICNLAGIHVPSNDPIPAAE